MEPFEGTHHEMPHLLENLYGRLAHEALYAPCAPQLAHYFGHRSLKGKTAAAGAHTALAMCVKALGVDFPMDDKFISGWHKELKKHVPTQQTPIGVAVVKHFQ